MSDLKKIIDNLFAKLRLDEKSILFVRGNDLNEKLSKDSVGVGTAMTRF